ncbi:enoyl-CoA hydratase-related protein [Lapillicoccus jejuensis]|uniref:Enoyl-CoA hydratase domain-containing protein 3, mitochondrial n=1 Tax=Lapillicoccus jejuensis TaxID=402171 RepID=A0A542E010_9MICO|nr:enoyl-CoA hydratase-related protein [Lapillicoccus jejuensis]TQJ08673.1 enoyl-CoA hydratase/carnithine racemase [Lapillicoccus jejuensis]
MTDVQERTPAGVSAATAGTVYEHVRLTREGTVATVTMARPQRRNALSEAHLRELLAAVHEVSTSDARVLVLAAEGPVFSAGHDFADVGGRDVTGVRDLLLLCTSVMQALQAAPQVTIARVHALATAAGCQLAASCDLAVAGLSAGFCLPGGKGGWFCHTPAVPVARAVGRKRLMEMALTGDVVPAATAAEWGLVNAAVPDDELDAAVADLAARVSRGGAASTAHGKAVLYAQLDRPERDAYAIAVEAMAAASQTAAATEGRAAFLEKRPPVWPA